MKVGLLIPTYLSCLKYTNSTSEVLQRNLVTWIIALEYIIDKRVQQKLGMRDLYLN